MGYTLEAVIGTGGAVRALVGRWPVAVGVPVAQGLVLVPMSDELFDAVGAGADEALGFFKLPAGLLPGPGGGALGYVEAEFFGGVGEQRAALWAEGELVLGPVTEDDAQGRSPISQVLARLGAVPDGNADEFDSVGLGRHRHTGDWLA